MEILIIHAVIVGAFLGVFLGVVIFPIGDSFAKNNIVISILLCIISLIATAWFIVIVMPDSPSSDSPYIYKGISDLVLHAVIGLLTTFPMPIAIKGLIKLYCFMIKLFRKK